MKLSQGTFAPPFQWPDVYGTPISLEPLRGHRVMLSFYRFAGCPLCNLRVHELIQEHPTLEEAGVRLLAFFQSPAESIRRNVGRQEAPFPILADPDQTVYARYGVARSAAGTARAMVVRAPRFASSLARGFWPRDIDGDPHLLPADFLIDETGIIQTAYYGRDIGDHVPLAQVLAFARGKSPETPSALNPATPAKVVP